MLQKLKVKWLTCHSNVGEDGEQLELSYTQIGGLAVSYGINIHRTYDPAIIFLGIYPKEMKKYISKRLESEYS